MGSTFSIFKGTGSTNIGTGTSTISFFSTSIGTGMYSISFSTGLAFPLSGPAPRSFEDALRGLASNACGRVPEAVANEAFPVV